MDQFKVLLASINDENQLQVKVTDMNRGDLPKGDVLIKVHYSSVNYKDSLAATNIKSGVVRNYPMVLGIDLSGVVVESKVAEYKKGDKVIVTSYDLGTNYFGGYSEYASVPAEWIVPLPDGISLKEAMIIGTAGFTAGQSVVALEEHNIKPEGKPILVRGATGGVGSMAIQMLSNKGYSVIAESRKKESQADYLFNLGAKEVFSPEEIQLEKKKPLSHQRFQAIVDPVGGENLADYLAQLEYGGSIALSGNAGGIKFQATVLPFILRGINLLGIDSVQYPKERRLELWKQLGNEMKPEKLSQMIDREVTLLELPETFGRLVAGKMAGRIIVEISK